MIALGKGGKREVTDYALTPLGLFAACQQSRLPELDLWFTFAGLQAAGYLPAPPAPASSASRVEPKLGATRMTLRQIGALAKKIEHLDPKTQYLLASLATQTEPLDPPMTHQKQQELMSNAVLVHLTPTLGVLAQQIDRGNRLNNALLDVWGKLNAADRDKFIAEHPEFAQLTAAPMPAPDYTPQRKQGNPNTP